MAERRQTCTNGLAKQRLIGAPASNFVGLENPDESISVGDSLYESLDAAQKNRSEHLRAEKALKK